MNPEARLQASERAQTMLSEMPRHEQNQVPVLSENMLMDSFHVEQRSIGTLEKHTDTDL